LITTIVSSAIASAIVIGVAVAGCIVFTVIAELTDEKQRPALALFSRHVTVFMIPLLSLFAYIVILWAAKIITV
jgi:uncharacterized PurR-regulated membrane protein YhhQ (DUF165 family)